jgi:hypothetical protein
MTYTLVRSSAGTITAIVLCLSCTDPGAAQDNQSKKPSLSLRVASNLSTAPSNVRATAVLRGGSNDTEDLYCPQIEWEWGDDTTSESSADCDPYQVGKSRITRRYSARHTFHYGGHYKVTIRLKQKRRTVLSASTNLRIQGAPSEF